MVYIEIVLFPLQCNPVYSYLCHSRSYLYLIRSIMPTHISINCIYTYIWIAQPSIFLYQQMHCIVSSHYHPLLIIFKHCDFPINLNLLSLCILHQCESSIGKNLSFDENLSIVRITHQPEFTITMYSSPV